MEKYLNIAGCDDDAKYLAGVLSDGKFKEIEGTSTTNKIYTFVAYINGEDADMVMTSVPPNLFEHEFIPPFHSNWHSCDPIALFDEKIEKVCTNLDIKAMLIREVQNCYGLVLWADWNREWDHIGWEIFYVCQDAIYADLQFHRAIFSEMTPAAILNSVGIDDPMTDADEGISEAVDVRRELALRIGFAFTRLQSIRLQEAFPTLPKDKPISYDSCQMPMLGFVVERFKAIKEFDAKFFWRIKSSLSGNDTINELSTDFSWKGGNLYDKNASVAILDRCKDATATIESVESNPTTKLRPLPLNTAEMAKYLSTALNMTVIEVMEIADQLYRKGFISYPRTETNIFPNHFDLMPVVEQQENDKRWGVFATGILSDGGPNARKGDKIDGIYLPHPPIHPTKCADNLKGSEELVFEFIARHFLASVSKDAIGRETIVAADIAGEKFVVEGLEILETNYLDVYIYEKWNSKDINQYQTGETFEHTKLVMEECSTSPPNLLSEADLITLMVQHGIGTESTYAKHIESLKNGCYVTLQEKLFMPTDLGIGIIEGYDNIEVPLAQPMLQAEFEEKLKLICDRTLVAEDVKSDQIQKYKKIYQIMEKRIKEFVDSVGNRLG